jgi:hypothetical protein
MVVVLIIIIVALVTMRAGSFIDHGRLQENPIGSLLYTLHDSREVMANLHSISELDTRERNLRVNEMEFGYRLVEAGDEAQGGFRPRIEITSTGKR